VTGYRLLACDGGNGAPSRCIVPSHRLWRWLLTRFYAICNCCSCCCGAMQAHRNGTPMLASSGYLAQVDADLCAACATCADHCQFTAISVDNGFAVIDAAACMGCGVCVAHCP
jgi:dissimilatory sulfite reductase (desulfoviridin) alpha/beta subunit